MTTVVRLLRKLFTRKSAIYVPRKAQAFTVDLNGVDNLITGTVRWCAPDGSTSSITSGGAA